MPLVLLRVRGASLEVPLRAALLVPRRAKAASSEPAQALVEHLVLLKPRECSDLVAHPVVASVVVLAAWEERQPVLLAVVAWRPQELWEAWQEAWEVWQRPL